MTLCLLACLIRDKNKTLHLPLICLTAGANSTLTAKAVINTTFSPISISTVACGLASLWLTLGEGLHHCCFSSSGGKYDRSATFGFTVYELNSLRYECVDSVTSGSFGCFLRCVWFPLLVCLSWLNHRHATVTEVKRLIDNIFKILQHGHILRHMWTVLLDRQISLWRTLSWKHIRG